MDERIFLQLMTRACAKNDVNLEVLSDGWLLRMQKGNSVRYAIGARFDLNSQACADIARDKAATSELLDRQSVTHIQHIVLKSANMKGIHGAKLDGMFKNGDVVIKPLNGEKGNYVKRVNTKEQVETALEQFPVSAWAASPFADISVEYRIVLIAGEVRLAYAKTHPVVIDNLKFFNLHKGAQAEPIALRDIPDVISSTAQSAIKALGLNVAAVDIVRCSNGDVYVLEVNAAFSLTRYAQTNPATFSEVAGFYQHLVKTMFTTPHR